MNLKAPWVYNWLHTRVCSSARWCNQRTVNSFNCQEKEIFSLVHKTQSPQAAGFKTQSQVFTRLLKVTNSYKSFPFSLRYLQNSNITVIHRWKIKPSIPTNTSTFIGIAFSATKCVLCSSFAFIHKAVVSHHWVGPHIADLCNAAEESNWDSC